MHLRKAAEQREIEWLASGAALSRDARRRRSEPECSIRTSFQRDRDRIIHSQAFRRLKSKTQVFLPPAGDHVRTRLTHTLEVTQIARTIARALKLNEDLTEAIGIGHDLGHTPFGHAGERALADVFPGFRHNEQSVRIVDCLEKDGDGLNLTEPVLDGILRHSKPIEAISGEVAGRPGSAEAQVVKISDGIAYINHDLDDAIRAGMLSNSDIPEIARSRLGTRHSERIDTLVRSVIEASQPNLDRAPDGRQVIVMDDDTLEAANVLRRFLFDEVYDPINQLPSTRFAARIVSDLFQYYVDEPDRMPTGFHPAASDMVERCVADYISGMTDSFAVRRYREIFMPSFEEV